MDLSIITQLAQAADPPGVRAQGRQGHRPRHRRRPRHHRPRHRRRLHLRQGHRVGDPPARDARRDHLDPVAGLRAHRGDRVLRLHLRPHRLLPRLVDDGRADHPAARPGGRGGEQQLPRQPERRADDLDAARVPRRVLRPAQVRVAADLRGAGQAPARDRGVDRRPPSARAPRPRSSSRSTASASARRARRPTRSSPARARPARSTSARRPRRPSRRREELLEQTRRDIEAETRRAIQEIRNEVADLTVAATEKVTRKTLTRTTSAASSRRRCRSSTSRRSPAGSAAASPWRRSPRSTRGRSSRSPRSTTSSTASASSSASSPTRWRRAASCQTFFFSPYFSTEEKKDGLDRAVTGERRDGRELPRAAHREPPDAGALPRPARARPPVARRTTGSCPSRSRARSRSTRRPSTRIGDEIGVRPAARSS